MRGTARSREMSVGEIMEKLEELQWMLKALTHDIKTIKKRVQDERINPNRT